ncbi:hypothetical protein INN71_03080 [Nocardioides sp. ChNu-153]|uniref:DUF6578 domain-containing protein n=1 Tax=unclassified Nocardioides TaxID=2615069 RepID=UPI0024054666|nr:MULTISPECIES: DUF6578 domain-containing protein [unclassified Nocardioides]MDF9716094.1 hypothetical protein [Nocardioides sp. ChNu-99]MDN7120369.1 hypothetical protein [Nocardioides sp. ChNu-153]
MSPPRPVEVYVGGWEHDCCGEAVQRGEVVRWTCLPYDGRLDRAWHLDPERAEPFVEVSGRVVDLAMVVGDGRVPVERLPSGSELVGLVDDGGDRSFDDDVVPTVVVVATGEVLRVDDDAWFVVTVQA